MLPFQWGLCLPVVVALCLAPVGASQPVSLNAKSVYDQLTVQRFAGSGTESVSAVATDRDGNIYVAGTTTSPDFPVTDPAATHIGVTLLRSDDLDATWKPLAQPSPDLKL